MSIDMINSRAKSLKAYLDIIKPDKRYLDEDEMKELARLSMAYASSCLERFGQETPPGLGGPEPEDE